jgi:hypothetical protein
MEWILAEISFQRGDQESLHVTAKQVEGEVGA